MQKDIVAEFLSPVLNGFKQYFLRSAGETEALGASLYALQLRYEKISAALTGLGFLVLSGCIQLVTPVPLVFFLIQFASVGVPTVAMILIPFRSALAHLAFSAYHVSVFLIFYYLPVMHPEHFPERPLEVQYLLHLFILLTQAVRAGRFVGFPVVVALIVHSIMEVSGGHSMTQADFVRVPLFLLAGAVSLAVESVLYVAFVEYLVLRKHRRRSLEELEMAQKVHSSLFPVFAPNDKLILSVYRNAQEITGGDFYDIIQLREGNLGFFLTDVSGHGISSAMMSAAIKVMISKMPYRFRLSPEAFLTQLDESMTGQYTSHHASAVYIFFDFINMTCTLANAGHPQVLYSKAGGAFREVETQGSLLGYGIARPVAREVVMPMSKGDRFAVYSDGLVEYRTPRDEIAQIDDPEELTSGLELVHGDQFIQVMLNRVKERQNFSRFHDDVMVALLEVR